MLRTTPFGTVGMIKKKKKEEKTGKCIRHEQLLMIPHDFGFPLQEGKKIQKKLKKDAFSAPAKGALTSIFKPPVWQVTGILSKRSS